MSQGTVLKAIDPCDNQFGLDSSGNLVLLTGGVLGIKGRPFQAAVTVAKGGSSNICLVSVQLQDVQGNNIAFPAIFDLFLSDSSAGIGVTATTPSGGIAAGAAGGAVIGTLTTSKAISAQANASGLFQLSITDTAKTAFYIVANINGAPAVLVQLASGNYD